MPTAVLTISYDGKPFCGFARQRNVLTVQNNLEDALRILYKREVLTTCAGRTDSGVHARGQVVSYEVDIAERNNDRFAPAKLRRSIDSIIHDDIHVVDVTYMDTPFSARHDAKSREYSYLICNQSTPSIIFGHTSWHISQKLDVTAMKQACQFLLGEQDFVSFCVTQSAKLQNSTCRNIISATIVEHNFFGDNIIEIKICGNAFLHSMVRTIVGTLVEVGLGKQFPRWVKDVINAKNRQVAGQCAPAQGLIFMHVNY